MASEVSQIIHDAIVVVKFEFGGQSTSGGFMKFVVVYDKVDGCACVFVYVCQSWKSLAPDVLKIVLATICTPSCD